MSAASDPETLRRQQVLRQSLGPAPWYWQTFPAVTGASGRRFEWTFHGAEGELAYLVTLNLAGEPEQPRLALNSYCRPFLVPPYYLGVWCPEGRDLRLLCFYPDDLVPFSLMEVVGWFKLSDERVYSAAEPVAEFEVPSALPEGKHDLPVPTQFRTLEEILLVGFYPGTEANQAKFAIYLVRPKEGTVEVLPQHWFNAEDYKVGPQWIARVARDPESHRLLGEAVRVGSFQLSADGRQVEDWLSREAG